MAGLRPVQAIQRVCCASRKLPSACAREVATDWGMPNEAYLVLHMHELLSLPERALETRVAERTAALAGRAPQSSDLSRTACATAVANVLAAQAAPQLDCRYIFAPARRCISSPALTATGANDPRTPIQPELLFLAMCRADDLPVRAKGELENFFARIIQQAKLLHRIPLDVFEYNTLDRSRPRRP